MRRFILFVLFVFVIQGFSEERKCYLICNDSLIQSVECKNIEEYKKKALADRQRLELYIDMRVRNEVRKKMRMLEIDLRRLVRK